MKTPQHPLVSVVVPMFNAERYIRQTLESVMSQTFSSWEIVVVDDGSTDESAAIVRELRNQSPAQIQLIGQANRGVSQARNVGVAESQGAYIAFLDADDLWHRHKLELQLQRLGRSQRSIGIGCWYTMRDMSGDGHGALVKASWDNRAIREWALLEGRGPLLPSTLLLPREEVTRIGGFNPSLSTAADLDFALKLTARGHVDCVKASLVTYQLQRNQMHRDLSLLRRDLYSLVEHSDHFGRANARTRIEVGLELVEIARGLREGQIARSITNLINILLAHPFLVVSTIIRRSLLRLKGR